MMVSVDELRMFVQTDESDPLIEFRIQSAESFVRKYTNNDFNDEIPNDVKFGIINMIKYDLSNRDKIGISSETISRHSVTYASGSDAENGYPSSVIGFLKPYIKARF